LNIIPEHIKAMMKGNSKNVKCEIILKRFKQVWFDEKWFFENVGPEAFPSHIPFNYRFLI